MSLGLAMMKVVGAITNNSRKGCECVRINFIIPFLSLTGGLKIIFEYATRLKENGDEIKIYVPCKPYREYYDNNILWAKNYATADGFM